MCNYVLLKVKKVGASTIHVYMDHQFATTEQETTWFAVRYRICHFARSIQSASRWTRRDMECVALFQEEVRSYNTTRRVCKSGCKLAEIDYNWLNTCSDVLAMYGAQNSIRRRCFWFWGINFNFSIEKPLSISFSVPINNLPDQLILFFDFSTASKVYDKTRWRPSKAIVNQNFRELLPPIYCWVKL